MAHLLPHHPTPIVNVKTIIPPAIGKSVFQTAGKIAANPLVPFVDKLIVRAGIDKVGVNSITSNTLRILNRLNHPIPVIRSTPHGDPIHNTPTVINANPEPAVVSERVIKPPNLDNTGGTMGWKITIVDLHYFDQSDSQYDPKYHSLDLHFVPKELSYKIESNFVAIASLGRNNPRYHYTGSEDTLEFTVDWHARDEDKKDVIYNCRWLESLTKNNGYKDPPHQVQIVWGQVEWKPDFFDDRIVLQSVGESLFEGDVWIVTDASYRLSNFHAGHRKYNDAKDSHKIQVGNLYPVQAYQDLTLKRVTRSNRFRIQTQGGIKPGNRKPLPIPRI